MKNVFVLFAIWFLIGAAHCQTFRFNRYTTENGISQNFIYCIEQDQYGFLWIGTGEGLCRFDGKNFIIYTTEHGLAENVITCSYKQNDGTIWFGHNNGSISKLSNGVFSNYLFGNPDGALSKLSNSAFSVDLISTSGRSTVQKIAGIDDQIYFLTQNEGLFKIENDKIISLTLPKAGAYTTLHCIDKENLLIGTSEGLQHIAVKNNTAELRAKYFDQEWITCIGKPNKDGAFLIGFQAGKITRARFHENKMQFSKYDSSFDLSKFLIKDILEDQSGNIWITTNGQGLVKLKLTSDGTDELVTYSVATGLASDFIQTSFEDREGNIWIGTFGSGLFTVVDDFFTFYSHENSVYGNSVSSFWIEENDFWYGVENGLVRISKSLEEGWIFYDQTNGLVNDCISSLYRYNDVLWIGTAENGLYKFDYKTQKISKVEWSYGNLCNNINQIAAEEDKVWVATDGGLVVYNSVLNAATVLNTEDGLAHNAINCIVKTKDDKVWMGTQSRYVFQLFESSIEEFEITAEGELNVVSIAEDASGTIWLATAESGVYKMAEKSFVHYSTADGLKSNYCYGIHPDPAGNIWVGHRGALSKIKTSTNEIDTYDHNAGITGQVNPNAFYVDLKNYFWIGTSDGAIRYDPIKDKLNETPPLVKIQSALIGDSTYFGNDELILPYGNYRLQFDFIGISFKNPEAIRYKFFLKGHDEVISDETDETIATYGKVADGDYEFHVYACNEDGVWSTDPAVFKLQIASPFWKKWWFYALIVIFLTLAIVIFVQWRLRRLKEIKIYLQSELKKKTKEVVEKAEKIEEINKDLTDSINYAKRIQTSILPDKKILSDSLPNSFVFYRPRDIVSGDFYFIELIDNRLIIACVDCTGHGVPGAFMSMIGSVTLRNLYAMAQWGWKSPEKILLDLDKEIEIILHQKQNDEMTTDEAFFRSRDGMDITLCEVNLSTKEVLLSSAMRNSIIIQDGIMDIVPGDKKPIGGGDTRNVPFTLKRYKMKKGDSLYLFSDGFSDQFGGDEGRKLKVSGVQKIIDDLQKIPKSEYASDIESKFNDWIADWDQIDDVLFIGLLF